MQSLRQSISGDFQRNIVETFHAAGALYAVSDVGGDDLCKSEALMCPSVFRPTAEIQTAAMRAVLGSLQSRIGLNKRHVCAMRRVRPLI